MSNLEIVAAVESLIAIESIIVEYETEAKVLREAIKNEMDIRGIETLNTGSHVVRFTSVLTSRFDTKRFKETFGESIYRAYLREVASRRFSIV